MRLVFLYGQPASGKLTVARALSALIGWPVFHNHLIVDALTPVFDFHSEAFARLREHFWLSVFGEAAAVDRSLIFTFHPEPTVAAGFAERAQAAVEAKGGAVSFVRLTVPVAEQEERLAGPGRLEFDKLRSVDLLRRLRGAFEACEEAMPQPDLSVDTSLLLPAAAAALIAERLGLPRR